MIQQDECGKCEVFTEGIDGMDNRNKKKRLMVLGASYSQIPLFRAARRMGVTTVAASIPGNYQGFQEADEIVYVDITDPEAVLKAAKEADIDGVATCCMDVGIRALGYVCEKMGLPGLSISAAEASCNKYLEKEAYIRHGVNTARFYKVQDKKDLEDALEELTFPVMVKAVDLMGSRGIFRCDTKKEALENFDKTMEATAQNFCIVEEFIQGTMFGVEAMVSKGELVYVLPLGNDLRQGNPPFPVGHHVPWEKEEALFSQIWEQTEKVVKAVGYDNCPLDLDCMFRDGKIYIIESTGRAGATCITDTVGIYYGIDYFEAIVRAALGMDVKELFQREDIPRTPSVTRLLSAEQKGIVEAVRIPEVLPEGVVDLSFNIEKGSQVQPMENGRDRIGQLIIRGNDLKQCYDRMETVLSQIHLEMKR